MKPTTNLKTTAAAFLHALADWLSDALSETPSSPEEASAPAAEQPKKTRGPRKTAAVEPESPVTLEPEVLTYTKEDVLGDGDSKVYDFEELKAVCKALAESPGGVDKIRALLAPYGCKILRDLVALPQHHAEFVKAVQAIG